MVRALYSITHSPCDSLSLSLFLSLSVSLTHKHIYPQLTGVAYEGQRWFTVVLIGSLEWERRADWLSALNQTLSVFFPVYKRPPYGREP